MDLQRERGMMADEAERVLRGENVDERMKAFLYERVQEVGRGIERATAFLETQEMGAKLSRLYLCGGGVQIPALAEALAERLGAETVIANPLEQVQVKPGSVDEQAPDFFAPMMMLSLGLALRGAS
jgi:type IV pilus assembly protein PilM